MPIWLTNRFKWNHLSPEQIEHCKNQLRSQGKPKINIFYALKYLYLNMVIIFYLIYFFSGRSDVLFKGVPNVDDFNYYSSHDLAGSHINNLGLNIVVPPQFVASVTSSIGNVYAILEDPLIKNKRIGDIDKILQNTSQNAVRLNINDVQKQKETTESRSIEDLKNLSQSTNNHNTQPVRRSRFWAWLLKDDENNIYKYQTTINSDEDRKHVTGEDWRQLFMEKYQKIPLTTREQDLVWKYMALGINEKHDQLVLWASGMNCLLKIVITRCNLFL